MSTINLLPRDYLQRRSQRRGNLICLSLLVAVAGSVGAAALVTERNARNTRRVEAEVSAQYAEAAKLIDEMHQLEAQKRRMLDKAKRSASLMERLPRSFVLAMINNALPKGAAVSHVQLDTKAVRPALPTPKGLTRAQLAALRRKAPKGPAKLVVMLNLRGRACTDVQVARFIANLAKHKLTEMVDLSYSKQSREGVQEGEQAVREFQLTVRLRPDADALDAVEPPEEDTPADPTAKKGLVGRLLTTLGGRS